jgi:tetratricopeptide (TPR) repeat protein
MSGSTIRTRPGNAAGKAVFPFTTVPGHTLHGCLLIVFFALLPVAVKAQVVIATKDPYAKLVFDPVPLHLATTIDVDDSHNPDTDPRDQESSASLARVSIREYRDAIDVALETEGPYSSLAREHYQAMARHQQLLGQHAEAVFSLEQAMHIARVNEGLFTPSQIEDLELILESLEASRNFERAFEYRGYLYFVQQRTLPPDDPRLLQATHAWASWLMQNYLQGINVNPALVQLNEAGQVEEFSMLTDTRTAQIRFIPRRNMNFDYGNAFITYSPEMIMDHRLRLVQETYRHLLQEHTGSIEDEESMLLRMLDADFAFKRQIDNLLGGSGLNSASVISVNSTRNLPVIGRSYSNIIDSLQAIVDKRRSTGEPDPTALATSLARIGDMHLVYDQVQRAYESYADARKTLLESGMDNASIDTVLLPEPLYRLPDFTTNLYSRGHFGISPDEKLEYRGYIDVSMTISRLGEGKGIKITAVSKGTPQRIRSKLLSSLRSQKFRPLQKEGTFIDATDVNTRFYYTY